MELKQIKELMTAMGRSGTKRLELKHGDFELILERSVGNAYTVEKPIEELDEFAGSVPFAKGGRSLFREAEMTGSQQDAASKGPAVEADIGSTFITSPMVGTFYRASSPDSAPFVKVGDKVDKNTVVCIIEAMKVMNEIKANKAGTVAEVLLESGHPVEFGTNLYRLVE